MKVVSVLLGVVMVCELALGSPVARNAPTEIVTYSKLEEQGGFAEGDMIFSPEQLEAIKNGYTAVLAEKLRWPNNIVPYKIDTTAFTSSQQNSILSALQQIELVSCVRFVPRTNQVDYVMVTGQASGCWAQVARQLYQQTVNLQPSGCMSRGTIIHEFLHALGVVHTQTGYDRDFYVDINWSAIKPEHRQNFEQYKVDLLNDFGIPYDYDSVMHYGPTAFTIDGQQTIVPKQAGVTIGQRAGLSYKDIKRINLMYPNCY